MSLRHPNGLPDGLRLDVDGTPDLSDYFTNVPPDRFGAASGWEVGALEWDEPAREPSPTFRRQDTPTLPMPRVLRSTLLTR